MTVVLSELDTKFKYDVACEPGGRNIKLCFACGLCTATCPVADIDEKFNPRRIIRMVLLGMRKEVLSSDTIWYCVQCYRCQGHCPQNVDFADIMKALRSMAVREGYIAPSFVEKVKEIDVFCQRIRHEMVNQIVEARSRDEAVEPSVLADKALQRL